MDLYFSGRAQIRPVLVGRSHPSVGGLEGAVGYGQNGMRKSVEVCKTVRHADSERFRFSNEKTGEAAPTGAQSASSKSEKV